MRLLYSMRNSRISNLPSNDGKDRWEYNWGTSYFSCSNAIKHLKGHMEIHHAFRWLWKSACQLKLKIFFWLLMQDKWSTREVLRRRNMVLEDYECAVCGTGLEETVEHLFLKCPFAIQCWASLNIVINLQHLQILE